jgi:hypothetical protein
MDSSSKALADATKLNNDLFELVEKLTIQLNAKDKELQDNKQENEVKAYFNGIFRNIKLHIFQKLLANVELEKTQAIETATENLNRELAFAQQNNLTLKMAIW